MLRNKESSSKKQKDKNKIQLWRSRYVRKGDNKRKLIKKIDE